MLALSQLDRMHKHLSEKSVPTPGIYMKFLLEALAIVYIAKESPGS